MLNCLKPKVVDSLSLCSHLGLRTLESLGNGRAQLTHLHLWQTPLLAIIVHIVLSSEM